ncbi:MAG: amidohydrolase [Chloroflexi bacterium]|nr:amidohydrolase [Chloroflexota bacterium]
MTVFKNGTLITMDPRRRIITEGAIAVQGDRIAAIGKATEVQARFPHDQQVDLQGNVVLPGLVDTHVHLAQAMIRGCADDLSLIDWLSKRVWVLQGNYDEDDGRTSAELCILEMLKSGTTAFVESMIAGRYGFDGIAEVVVRSGIRAALSKVVMDIPTYATQTDIMYPGMKEDPEISMRQALEAHDKWQGAADGRIQVWFGPRPPGGCTPELYRRVARHAAERGMSVTIHLAEVQADVEYIRREYGMSPTEYMESVGLLGPNVLLIHAVWMDADDIARLARTGTHVTHNPLSNTKLASGIAPVPEMLAAGVNVSIGCDGGPSNNAYDMVRDLRWASYLHKVRALDPTIMPAETVLEMATINGAKAMGLADQIGSLEVGKKADFVVIAMNKPHLTPSPNPVSTIVCAATGQDVDTVVIDGKIIVQGGRVLTMDEERILAEARERAEKLYRRAGIEIRPRWPVM